MTPSVKSGFTLAASGFAVLLLINTAPLSAREQTNAHGSEPGRLPQVKIEK